MNEASMLKDQVQGTNEDANDKVDKVAYRATNETTKNLTRPSDCAVTVDIRS